MNRKIESIVLTGGPCSGKTESIAELKKYFTDLKYKVISIPEMATEIRRDGLIHTEGTISKIDFQKAIFELQLYKEDLYKHMMMKNEERKKMILLLDRGLLDAKVYLDELEFKKLLNENKLTEKDIIDRYSVVLHLESTANSQDGLYSNTTNKFRLSNPEQAIIQEQKSIKVWSEHPNFHIVSLEKSFDIKLAKIKKLVINEINNFKSIDKF